MDYWGQVESMRRGVITTKLGAAAAHCMSKRGDSGVTADDRPSSYQQSGTQMFLWKSLQGFEATRTDVLENTNNQQEQTLALSCTEVSLELEAGAAHRTPAMSSRLDRQLLPCCLFVL